MDESFSPFPSPGRMVEFRFRRAVWAYVEPMYNENDVALSLLDIYRVLFVRFWFPFICWRITCNGIGIHGYIGWKPIPVNLDPAFYWRDLHAAQMAIASGERFVQLSIRGGIGDIG